MFYRMADLQPFRCVVEFTDGGKTVQGILVEQYTNSADIHCGTHCVSNTNPHEISHEEITLYAKINNDGSLIDPAKWAGLTPNMKEMLRSRKV